MKNLNAAATTFASVIGLSPQEAQSVHRDLINNELSPPDEETIQKRVQQTRETLAAKFGAEKASVMISRAQAALKNSPYLKKGRITSPEALLMIYEKFEHPPLKVKK